MPTILRTALLVLTAAALLAAPFVVGDHLARAAGATCSATMAGLETGKKTPVEIVAFNPTGVEIRLDLRVLDASGELLRERPDEIVLTPFRTAVVSVEEFLSRDLAKKEKPYSGLVAVELTGDAPFAEDTVIVHATQYFGKRKKPRGAVIHRPLFRDVE